MTRKLSITGSDNGLSSDRRQAIIWTNASILIIGTLGTNFNEILIEIHKCSFRKIPFKMSSGKWRPSCLGLNVLINFVRTVSVKQDNLCVLCKTIAVSPKQGWATYTHTRSTWVMIFGTHTLLTLVSSKVIVLLLVGKYSGTRTSTGSSTDIVIKFHRCGHHQAACHEPAGSYGKTIRTAICFEHKMQYLLIRAPYTRIVVFWHISKIPPMIVQSQISCNTPTFCIATKFVKYCYTTGSWLL